MYIPQALFQRAEFHGSFRKAFRDDAVNCAKFAELSKVAVNRHFGTNLCHLLLIMHQDDYYPLILTILTQRGPPHFGQRGFSSLKKLLHFRQIHSRRNLGRYTSQGGWRSFTTDFSHLFVRNARRSPAAFSEFSFELHGSFLKASYRS